MSDGGGCKNDAAPAVAYVCCFHALAFVVTKTKFAQVEYNNTTFFSRFFCK